MSSKKDTRQFAYKTTLIQSRGWTEWAIKKWLGEPDKLAPNPHYRSGPKSQLYDMERVVKAELLPEFQEWHAVNSERRASRSTSAKKAADSRSSDLVTRCREIVRIECLASLRQYQTFEELSDAAIQNWHNQKTVFLNERNRFEELYGLEETPSPDSETLFRWVVNFVRHQLSSYDFLLREGEGTPGISKARDAMREIVGEAVKSVFSEKGWASPNPTVQSDDQP